MNMIEVKNVTMKFRLANDKIQSLKEYFIALTTKKLKYKELCVFSDLNFDIKKGEVVGIIGRNGAGKSTLLKIISGVLAPTEGSVKSYGNIVPMLELGSGFDIELSGRENIYLNGSILGYSKKFLEEKFDEILEFSELGEFIEEPIRNYSSGMLMRLAFSIATIVHPEILIVDEILAVGDEAFQRKSKRKMLELMGGGTTVLFVSHSIDQIKEMCSRVIWIENGKIQKDGDAKEVCDAYQKFLNPEQNIYQAQKTSLRNIDAYKYLMDVLIVYNEDDLSYYTALARKEQLLAGNLCAQELCILDLNKDVIKQYRQVLFVNCRLDDAKKYISELSKRNKSYVAECHDCKILETWRKNDTQMTIVTNEEQWVTDQNIYYMQVPVTERLQQVALWAKYDRDELPFKKVSEIESEQELINYNRAVLTKKKHQEDGPRVCVICDESSIAQSHEAENAEMVRLGLKARWISNRNFEDVLRTVAITDVALDLSTELLAHQMNEMLCGLVDIPYCEDIDELKEYTGSSSENMRGKAVYTTLLGSVKFANFMKQQMKPSKVYLFKQLRELEKYPAIAEQIKKNIHEEDITLFVTSLQENEAQTMDDRISVVNKATKYILGGFDTVVTVNEDEFTFMLTYPNIQRRIYYVSHWGPGDYDCGDFNRIRINQTYVPCMDVEYWTSQQEIVEWLKKEYGQNAKIV